MYVLTEKIEFPDIATANKEGLLAVGGDLCVDRLIHAYKHGIFPWFERDEPILWWSPDPRFVLFPHKLKVSKSMRQVLRNKDYVVTINKDFKSVIQHCAKIKRQGQSGTWITDTMMQSYSILNEKGIAKSVEVWNADKLIGGFYGIDLNNGVFCGESMFSLESNASKIALITFVQSLNYKLIDCQVFTNHLQSLGAEEITRNEFLTYL